MASKRRQRRRGCQSKVKFDTQQEAEQAAHHMRRRYLGESFNVYRCKLCGHWKVGHTPRQVKQAITTRRNQK